MIDWAAVTFGGSRDARAESEIDDHLIALSPSNSAEFEQYLVLRQAVERARATSGVSVIGVTSATVADGKTTTAINLAGALNRSYLEQVLLIDADLRLPSVATRLGMADADQPGLAEAIADPKLALKDVIRRHPPFNLSVLPAGRLGDANPYELFQSARFKELLAEARQLHEYVVLDTPPVVPVPDCRLLESVVDAFLVVVAAHRTPRRLLSEALTVLGPARVLGLVFNRADRPYRGYYNAYYEYGGSRGRTHGRPTGGLSSAR